MLGFNNDGKVADVSSLNEEAKIFTKELLGGLDLVNAANKVLELATENGYLKDVKELNIGMLDGGNEAYLETIKNQPCQLKLTMFLSSGRLMVKPIILIPK